MKNTRTLFSFLTLILMLSACTATHNTRNEKTALQKSKISENLSLGLLDSATQVALDYYNITKPLKDSLPLVDGRRIIYRDLRAAKSATLVSGRVSVRTCVNREGIVTYVHIVKEESTITNKDVLKNYLVAAAGYRFEAKADAPEIQCGKMTFTIDNSRNRTQR
jgi:hypothetical protein